MSPVDAGIVRSERMTVADQRDLLAEFVARLSEDACCQAHRDEADELLAKVERMGGRRG